MQIRRLSFSFYWLAATALVAVIGSGASIGADISHQGEQTVANADMAESQSLAPALAEATPAEPDTTPAQDQVGIASWYGLQHQGRLTASGQRFDEDKLTAAHRTLPLDTRVKVTNLENGRAVEVKVNDRGPYISGRVLDLSTRAAKELGMQKEGLALVRIEILPLQFASAVGD
jgi:rare lipoprotein A